MIEIVFLMKLLVFLHCLFVFYFLSNQYVKNEEGVLIDIQVFYVENERL